MKQGIRWGLAAVVVFAATAASAVTFSMVSLRSDGKMPSTYSAGSDQPALTPDGRYVVFIASSPDLATPASSGAQVFLRDRVAGTTELVSISNSGEPGNATSSRPSISDDGCRVVFMSFASNLASGDAASTQDVFVRNRCTQPATTSLVSASSTGGIPDGQSYEAAITGDGSKAFFTSYAKNLVPGLAGAGNACLYVRDLNANTTGAILGGNARCVQASTPSPSRDGSRVAFWALYSPVTGNTLNGVWQIHVYDSATQQFVVASSNMQGTPQSQSDPGNPNRPGEGVSTVSEPALSSDGGYVAFRSRGFGLTDRDGGGTSHVFVKELATGFIGCVSVDSNGNLGNADSSGSGSGYRPGISRYARTVTYLTNATNLAVETAGYWPNVVAHNPRTGQTIGFTSLKTLNGLPNIDDEGRTIIAASGYALDANFTGRGTFAFPVMLARVEDIVTYYYQSILRRDPDGGGLMFWSGEANRMDRLGISVNEVLFALAGTFFTSAEYQAFNRDNTAFVTDLYTTFFNRAPDQAGLDYWRGQLDQGLPREVALAAFTFSPEFANFTQGIFGITTVRKEIDTAVDFFRGLLARLPDDGGFKYWLAQFRTAQCQGGAAVNAQVESISSAFANSPEYGNRARNNAQYVGDLYNAFLRRGGDLGGVQFWISQISTGARSRENVRQAFVASPEFQARVVAVINQGCLP